jgi:sugar phosphate isomerase/epimerase
MPHEIFLASSVIEGFDGHQTIKQAQESGFDGVQLYLDPRYRDPEYTAETIALLCDSGLGLAIHLPNTVTEEDLAAAEVFVEKIPDVKIFIHFSPTTEAPKVKGTKVGWENSLTGVFDTDQIEEIIEKVAEENTFFVFDPGRIMYTDEETSKEEIVAYIREKLGQLDPERDILHIADKECWTLRFRDCMCVLGEGVCAELLEDIAAFPGIIVIEMEDLEMALDSLEVIKEIRL